MTSYKRKLQAVAKAHLAACDVYLDWCSAHPRANPERGPSREACAKSMITELAKRGFAIVRTTRKTKKGQA